MRLKQIVNATLFISSIALIACNSKSKESKQLLPIFGEKKLSNTDTIYHTISQFSFINQYKQNSCW
jgi:vacuolar-type H+-ATPase subunit B/Vma2